MRLFCVLSTVDQISARPQTEPMRRHVLTTPPWDTRPQRCRRPFPLLDASKTFLITALWPNSPFLTVWSMRTTSCHTTRPAPMLRWPTSEFPIRPSGRPTASDEASSSVKPVVLLENASMTGVSAAAIASPFLGDSSVGIPQPSITTRRPQQHHDQPPHLEVYQDVTGDERVVGTTGRTQAGLVVGSHIV